MCLWLIICNSVKADDGYRLWLKYDLIPDVTIRNQYLASAKYIATVSNDAIVKTAVQELQTGLQGLLGKPIPLYSDVTKSGGVILRILTQKDQNIGNEGFIIKVEKGNIIISANQAPGLLYGVFELLRAIQILKPIQKISDVYQPRIQLRMLNHWDNVNGTIERGYAGASLWKWYELPETLDPRYRDYARANASIGINAIAINNVNASARFLTAEYLVKVKALADLFRQYNIKVFLSINFASPKILSSFKTSDPLDPQVRAWWAAKAKEIYTYIPDFGGFLVKANSEGEPGPQEYGRTHADGANMLAEALQPHNGLVIWRAFVYSPDPQGDRFKEAYNEFKPLDGTFSKNVIIQVKNGPIDFQPREPFHPLFGAMPKTPLAMEFQITQEYLGFSTNLVYLAPLFKECLESDTYANGKGSTVAKVVDGSVHNYPITIMAGVANTGSDRNWTGHFMSQANWYAFGRLAWNHELSSEQIMDEWIPMTLTKDKIAQQTIKNMMLKSREIYVNFTTPLGLHHVMGQGIHFGPEPWLERSARPDWTSIYYHRADNQGIGFNRTSSGSKALTLYHPEVQKQWNDPATTDLKYLLWFHHINWNQQLSTGRTLWDEMVTRYYTGVKEVNEMQKAWASVKNKVDAEIFADVAGRLAAQHREALNWRDACVLYFQTFSQQPIPAPFEQPKRTLEELKEIVKIYQLR
ncbi:MAG: alpha-glucuronidase family glycosyl hydrolase [Saprospiraceae bacterium]